MNRTFSPSLVFGFAAAVLTIVPGLKNLACCLLLPAAGAAAVYVTQKLLPDEQIYFSKALKIGFLTGVFTTLFGTTLEILMTFLLRSNDLTETLPEVEKMLASMNLGSAAQESIKLLRKISQEITESGFSLVFSIMLFISNFIVNLVFGIAGALLGMAYINKK